MDTHLDWKLWGEAGAVEIKLAPVRECRIIGNILNSMKRCRIIGDQQERVCKEKKSRTQDTELIYKIFRHEKKKEYMRENGSKTFDKGSW